MTNDYTDTPACTYCGSGDTTPTNCEECDGMGEYDNGEPCDLCDGFGESPTTFLCGNCGCHFQD